VSGRMDLNWPVRSGKWLAEMGRPGKRSAKSRG